MLLQKGVVGNIRKRGPGVFECSSGCLSVTQYERFEHVFFFFLLFKVQTEQGPELLCKINKQRSYLELERHKNT